MHTSSYHPAPGERIRYFNNTQDGHGGHSEEHREEMRQIAEDTVKVLVPSIAKQICAETFQSIFNALQYDIETVVNISFDDAHDIFTSSRVRKYMSDRITNEVIKRLNTMTFPDVIIR